MATILLSAAGAAIGGALGGSVMGLSSVVVGRFAGAVLGRQIDQHLLGQGADPVETGRVDRLRLTGAGEGDAIARIHGRLRVPGQVIWATRFTETLTVTGGGSGGGSGKGTARSSGRETRRYSYSVSVAIALGEGEMSGVGRIWADGAEIDPDSQNWRFYPGDASQLPDPLIEAVEGAGQAPAFRGTAYVVIEDLGLGPWGNRVPQFNFEVFRPAAANQSLGANQSLCSDPARAIRGVAMLPGSGEYALATQNIHFDHGAGQIALANQSTPSSKPDFLVSLDRMDATLPNCQSVSLILSWFGDDLRCGACSLRPMVEQNVDDPVQMPWAVSGVTRSAAQLVPQKDGRPVYGGTPADGSVVQAIQELTARGQSVVIYPFLLMAQMAENGLPDPWSKAENQPILPWRGRITCAVAPGMAGTSDGTAAADTEVAAFFGAATAADFTIAEGQVIYTGPEDWGLRRFILHYAALSVAAGGVDAICIGSEMRGLTQIRGATGFPAVSAFQSLAAEVRSLVGPGVKIGYAADWSEYFGYQPQDGSGDRYFHLDPLWADQNIDFVGIDNYMPLSDWRAGETHADAHWGAVHELAYLQANIEGGEGYDWYYPTPEAEAAQRRVPITDEAHDEPWLWRYKDIRNWWQNYHHERIGGQRQDVPTDWEPQSKPIWFTELGCPAVDKGTNQPNVFLDPKSSESAAPRHSSGARDDLIQMQYLRATLEYWSDAQHNPISPLYQGPMIDTARSHVWAWDARPFPHFPARDDLWGDGANYDRGHWITGRAAARSLGSVVAEICDRSGLTHYDVSDLRGLVWGYQEPAGGSGRQALQPLLLRYGVDAVDRDGVLAFVMRDGRVDATLTQDDLARDNELDGIVEASRSSTADMAGRVRVQFLDADSDYAARVEEAILPGDRSGVSSGSEMSLAMRPTEGRAIAERWLTEARVARDQIRLALPPSKSTVRAGDVVAIDTGDTPAGPDNSALSPGLYRVDQMERAGRSLLTGVRIDPEAYRPFQAPETAITLPKSVGQTSVFPLFLDLPLITGQEQPHAPHIAVTGQPWPGSAAVYLSDEDADYRLDRVIGARSIIGITETALDRAPSGVIDRGARLVVRLTSGTLSSVSEAGLLNGRNLCAIGDGSAQGWELFQFRDADPVAENRFTLSHVLRGQLGTETDMAATWPVGSYVVVMDGTPDQLGLLPGARGYARHLRVGPAGLNYSDPAYRHDIHTFTGIGLRPYAPVHLRATLTGPGDVALHWIRRTRLDGDRWDLAEVPLGEADESYEVSIYRGTALLRSVIVDAPEWLYPAGLVAADGGVAGLDVRVAQVSAEFGPGAVARLVL